MPTPSPLPDTAANRRGAVPAAGLAPTRLAHDSGRRELVTDDTGAWTSVRAGTLNVLAYGLVADGTTDNADAFEALLHTLPAPGLTTANTGNTTLFFPPGIYRFSRQITIDRVATFVGAGPGGWEYGGTIWLFDATVTGGVVVTNQPNASYTHFQQINITMGLGTRTPGAHGFTPGRMFTLSRVHVTGWTGHCLNITDGPNTNNSHVEYSTFWGAGAGSLNACRVTGSDSNVISFLGCTFGGAGKWCVQDTCLCGNTYISCHCDAGNQAGGVDGVDGGAFYVHNAAGGTLVGCYTEGGYKSTLGPTVTVCGGDFGGGFTDDTTAGRLLGRELHQPALMAKDASGVQQYYQMDASTGGAHYWHADNDPGVMLFLDGSRHRWGIGAVNTPAAMEIVTGGDLTSDRYNFGRVEFPRGVWLAQAGTTGMRVFACPVDSPLTQDVAWYADQDSLVVTPRRLLRATANVGVGTVTWTANADIGWPGSGFTPTTPNGYLYRARVSPSRMSGPTEPTWPTTLGQTVTESTGLVWECWGYTSGHLVDAGLPDPSSLVTNTVPVADGAGNWATRAVTAVSDPTYGENGAVPYIQNGAWERGNVSRFDVAISATTFDLATAGDWAHAQVNIHAEADIAAGDWPSGAVVSAGTHVGDRRVVVVTGAHTIGLPSESMHTGSNLVLESTAVDLTPGSILELEWFSGAWYEVRRRLVPT